LSSWIASFSERGRSISNEPVWRVMGLNSRQAFGGNGPETANHN
jgi:hypothetical protein